MKDADLLAALTPVITTLEDLHVPYYIAGSVASSVHGVARTTLDVDLVCDLRTDQVAALVRKLESAYYVDEGMIRDALAGGTAFNVVHLGSMMKVDVFPMKSRRFDRQAMERRSRQSLDEDRPSFAPFVASAEDTILSKLEWSRRGGGVSERQWRDVVGVLQVQERALDLAYLRDAAAQLGVSELLDRAIEDAGIEPT